MTNRCYIPSCNNPTNTLGGDISVVGVTLNPRKYKLCREHLHNILNFVEGKSGAISTRCLNTRQHNKIRLSARIILDTLAEIDHEN